MSAFYEFVSAIPQAFWGVLLGSIFSLAAVIITNRANHKRMLTQFDHQRYLQNSDRELALRKDVYLAAAEAMAAGSFTIGKLADLDTSVAEISAQFSERAPSIAKIQIVGKETTIEAGMKYSAALGSAFMELVPKRIQLEAQKQQLEALDRQIVRNETGRDQMIELMRQYNLDGRTDKEQFATINGIFEFDQKNIADALEQKNGIAAALFHDQLDFSTECARTVTEIQRHVIPTVVEMRKELGLPIDVGAYGKIASETSEQALSAAAKFTEEVRNTLNPSAS